MQNKAQVKKVKAFPFPISFKTDAAQFSGQVLMMNQTGFMAEVSSQMLSVGNNLEFNFELPVMHFKVSGTGIVVKIYNQMTGGSSSNMKAEVHFKLMNDSVRQKLTTFLNAAVKTGHS